MGHNIEAIITRARVSEEVANKYDLPVITSKEFSIIALDPSHSDYWAEKIDINNEADNKIILNCPVTHFFAKELGLKEYAVIYTDYFGGVGDQYATVFNKGVVTMPETINGINKALKQIGVMNKPGFDEFDTLGLGMYRTFDDYFEKYY